MNKRNRLNSLYGEEKVTSLKDRKIMIIGLGGVGSYAAEAIVRSFVGNIIIMDSDDYDLTNMNRQLHCDDTSVGRPKVEVIGENMLRINPDLNLKIYNQRLTEENIEKIVSEDIDFIIDAIDDTKVKISLIKYCYDKNIDIITSCGTANKMHPEKLMIDDIFKTSVCPLARKLRTELKKLGVKKLPVVYSTEKPQVNGKVLGSTPFVPGTAGLILASYVINSFIE